MSIHRRFTAVLTETLCALLIVAGLAMAAIPAFAQTYTDLHDFMPAVVTPPISSVED